MSSLNSLVAETTRKVRELADVTSRGLAVLQGLAERVEALETRVRKLEQNESEE